MNCRHCGEALQLAFLDLGHAPPSNAYVSKQGMSSPEVTYPLRLSVCQRCWLVQTEDYSDAEELFSNDYAYFSSTSRSWLEHAADYCVMAVDRFNLDQNSLVMEIAANDGYLLKNFVQEDIPCLGIEPTASTADAAERLGVPILREFFGTSVAEQLSREGRKANLIVGNNVYAHVPDINDFTAGLRIALADDGHITLEFPHLLQLLKLNQFDTVYHEHFSYLSLTTVCRIFSAHDLRVYDVEKLSTHGGSLRIFACHDAASTVVTSALQNLLDEEREQGLLDAGIYQDFQVRADTVKDNFLRFLLDQRDAGKCVAAYGAAAKGNTLLNYAGVRNDLIDFVCDAAVSKQGKYLPGSHIPILAPEALSDRRPDWIIIFPWNIAPEIVAQLAPVNNWGARYIIFVPEMRELE